MGLRLQKETWSKLGRFDQAQNCFEIAKCQVPSRSGANVCFILDTSPHSTLRQISSAKYCIIIMRRPNGRLVSICPLSRGTGELKNFEVEDGE